MKKVWLAVFVMVLIIACLFLEVTSAQSSQAHVMYVPMVLKSGGTVIKVKMAMDVPDTVIVPVVTPEPPDDTIVPNVDPEPSVEPPYRWRWNIQNDDAPEMEPGKHNIH